MAIGTGILGVLKINTGSVGTPVYTMINAQRDASIDFDKRSVDVTHKGDSGWERTLGVSRSVTITAGGLVDEVDVGYLALRAVFWANVQMQFQFLTPGAITYTGTFEKEKLNESYPYQDAVGWQITLKSVGIIVQAP